MNRVLTFLCWLACSSAVHGHLLSSAERLDAGGSAPWVFHNAPFFQVWRDYAFVYRSKPLYLVGGDQILPTYFQDANDPDYRLRLTLSAPATVYLLIDNKVPNVAAEMPWVFALGFTDTGDDAQIEVSTDSLLTTASIYAASFAAGEVVLLQQADSSPVASPAGMYTVAVVPEPGRALSMIAMGVPLFFRKRPCSPS